MPITSVPSARPAELRAAKPHNIKGHSVFRAPPSHTHDTLWFWEYTQSKQAGHAPTKFFMTSLTKSLSLGV